MPLVAKETAGWEAVQVNFRDKLKLKASSGFPHNNKVVLVQANKAEGGIPGSTEAASTLPSSKAMVAIIQVSKEVLLDQVIKEVQIKMANMQHSKKAKASWIHKPQGSMMYFKEDEEREAVHDVKVQPVAVKAEATTAESPKEVKDVLVKAAKEAVSVAKEVALVEDLGTQEGLDIQAGTADIQETMADIRVTGDPSATITRYVIVTGASTVAYLSQAITTGARITLVSVWQVHYSSSMPWSNNRRILIKKI